MAMQRQWPALPSADPEQLRIWAEQITKLLRSGDIATGADIDGLDAIFLTPAEGDAAYVNVAGDTMTGPLTITGASTGPLTLVSTDAGAGAGPIVMLDRQSASPAASDLLGEVHWKGRSSTGVSRDLAALTLRYDDPTNGAESASMLATWIVGGSLRSGVIQAAGKQSIWVPATAMWKPTGAGGPSSGQFTVSSSVMQYLAYDAATIEDMYFNLAMPKAWDVGNISAQVYWSHPATTTNFGVVWNVFGIAYGDNEAIAGTPFGGSGNITDTGGTTNNLYISPESSGFAIGSTPADGNLINCIVRRMATDGSDTLAVDAFLHGVMIFYTTNAPNDL